MNIATFDFNETPVRVVQRGGEPWFVAADVCRVLDIQNPSDALKALDEADLDSSEVRSESTNGVEQRRAVNIVNESGLYQLVFSSRKPEAKAFKRWVTKEVLPAIRKTGRYTAAAVEEAHPLADAIEALQGNVKAAMRARELVLDGQMSLETAQVVASLCCEVRTSWAMRIKLAPLPSLPACEPLEGDEVRELVCVAAGKLEGNGSLSLAELCEPPFNAKSMGRKLAELRGLWMFDSRGRKFYFGHRRSNSGALYTFVFENGGAL